MLRVSSACLVMFLDNPTTSQDSILFNYEKRYWYPHMKPYDRAIWERFIEANPDKFIKVAYDVCVGTGSPANPIVSEQTGGDVYKLYQRKIDVVAFDDKATHIIELKPEAGPSSVGQVLFYKMLFVEDFKPEFIPRCVIITDKLLPGMARFAELYDVNIIVA